MNQRLNHDRNREINRLLLQGLTCAEVAKRVGVSTAVVVGVRQRHSTLYRASKEHRRAVTLPKISILERTAS